MSRHDDNATAFTDLVADMLAQTRGWKRGRTVEHGLLMELPDGGARLLVTRIWGEALCNSDIVSNATRFATHHGYEHGGAVLALLSTLGDLGWAYTRTHPPFDLEVLDEPMIAGLAGGIGLPAMERYARILQNQGYGRQMLPREKWAKPKRQGTHPALSFSAQDVRAAREAKGLSMADAKDVVVKERLKAAIAHLRTDRDFDLLVDVVEMLVDNVDIRR